MATTEKEIEQLLLEDIKTADKEAPDGFISQRSKAVTAYKDFMVALDIKANIASK